MTQDLVLSRKHFQVENQPPLCHLVDLGSTNGTKVNGLRVTQVTLREGDVITAGDSAFIVHFMEDSRTRRISPACAGCGGRIPIGPPTASSIDRTRSSARAASDVWLCEACQARRLKFPKTAPDYLIEEWIGGGGMGEVFRARQLSQNRPVAIKMMSTNSAIGDKASSYFRREIEVLQRPADARRPDPIPASSASTRSTRSTPSSSSSWSTSTARTPTSGSASSKGRCRSRAPPRSAGICSRRSTYAHSKGYVHRDVKPSNLLIIGPVHRPRVKLSDFGLAKSFAETEGLTSLTRQGDIGGSIGFISPDHIRDFSEIREPADIYSAGATLFYLLTSKYPYLGFDPRQPTPTRSSSSTPRSPCEPSAPTPPRAWSESC